MELPVRIESSPPASGVVAVDGAWGSEGLNLSHWPGNTTPRDLVHELSTGCALRFARLAPAERERRALGAEAIVNNHFDTDGVMALFATRHPRAALGLEQQLLDAAAAGDFYRIPNDRALALDALVTRIVDPRFSPLARELASAPSDERYTRVTLHLLDELPRLLSSDRLPHEELWLPVLERIRSDLDELAHAQRSEDEHLDLCSWIFRDPWRAEGPGRHALFGSTTRDRVLAVAPAAQGGHLVRLVISTLSWFEPVSQDRLPRPALAALADELNQLEPDADPDGAAWRAQDPAGAAPELWFGASGLAPFAEHSDALRPSALAPEAVCERVAAALDASRCAGRGPRGG